MISILVLLIAILPIIINFSLMYLKNMPDFIWLNNDLTVSFIGNYIISIMTAFIALIGVRWQLKKERQIKENDKFQDEVSALNYFKLEFAEIKITIGMLKKADYFEKLENSKKFPSIEIHSINKEMYNRMIEATMGIEFAKDIFKIMIDYSKLNKAMSTIDKINLLEHQAIELRAKISSNKSILDQVNSQLERKTEKYNANYERTNSIGNKLVKGKIFKGLSEDYKEIEVIKNNITEKKSLSRFYYSELEKINYVQVMEMNKIKLSLDKKYLNDLENNVRLIEEKVSLYQSKPIKRIIKKSSNKR